MTLKSKTPRYMLHKLKTGLMLRCPECEHGHLFDGFYQMHATCPYCQVRFGRSSGDMVGGTYINIIFAELTALAGFFLVHNTFAPPIIPHLMFWMFYLLAFSLVFYRNARGLWVGVVYLTGGVYPDPDYTKEYFGPSNPISLSPEEKR
jgi:uncharacterized protein (DUF983 family)